MRDRNKILVIALADPDLLFPTVILADHNHADAGAQAMQCLKAIQVKSPIVAERYNRVVELAFSDPQAEFTPEERQLIAGHINGGTGSRDTVVRFRATAAEKEDLQRRADVAGVDVSGYIRSLLWPE